MNIKSVYRHIMSINKLDVAIWIPLNSSADTPYGKPLTELRNESLRIYLNPYLILNIKGKGMNNRRCSVMFSVKTLPKFIKALKKLKKLFKEDIYYYTNNRLEIFELTEKHVVRVQDVGENNTVFMFPTIVTDSDLQRYEGACVCFNEENIRVDLSIDELNSLYHMVKRIDLIGYSQLILNYVSIVQDSGINNKPTYKQYENSIFDKLKRG